ncbi:MAG: DNA/RNA non-specific endonuclease, partial [Wujia sp.]
TGVVVICALLAGIAFQDDTSDWSTETTTEVVEEVATTETIEEQDTKETATTTEELVTSEFAEDTHTVKDALADEQMQEDIITDIPVYNGYAYVEVNNNIPYFTDEEKQNVTAFETYSDLDELGRCDVAYANVCRQLQPTQPRGEIGSIRPSGWHTIKYSEIISDNYLYNRCHLIGYQLTGENANEKNLITGTRYLNVAGMLPFENQIADYLSLYDNHVLYRVTPVFEGDNLVASGVRMEGYSVEDAGAGICFHVYCYNVQPGIGIDYATGDSCEDPSVVAYDADYPSAIHRDTDTESTTQEEEAVMVWISQTGSKYHRINDCGKMNPDNATQMTRQEAEDMGYEPCGICY